MLLEPFLFLGQVSFGVSIMPLHGLQQVALQIFSRIQTVEFHEKLFLRKNSLGCLLLPVED